MKRNVMIIGGGASGMTAAIAAAREGARVVILEHTKRPGKKILSTGNGKCNLTNLDMRKDAFRGEHPGFAWKVIEAVPVKETVSFFEDLGLVLTDRNGYVYPATGQASSVLDALRFELERLKIPVLCECEVSGITKKLELRTTQGVMKADAVILAAGSKAAPGTGSDGSGYKLAGSLGHRVIEPLPALVQLKCRETWYKQFAGVRTDAFVTLFCDGHKTASDRGELQFTDYGISGIPVFQVSRFASRALNEGKRVTVRLDLLPVMDKQELFHFLTERVRRLGYRPGEEFLNSVLNKKLHQVLLKESGIPAGRRTSEITEKQLRILTDRIKALETTVTGVNSFDQAQICCGGVDTREINPCTMESKLVSQLFLAGEILDVDGICGGYNLQWAWSSGILAGRNAGRGPI